MLPELVAQWLMGWYQQPVTEINWCTTNISSGAAKWKHAAGRRTRTAFQSSGLLTSCSGEELMLESVTYSQLDAECRVSMKTFTSPLSRIDFSACLSPLLSHHAPVCSRSFLPVCTGWEIYTHITKQQNILQLRLNSHRPKLNSLFKRLLPKLVLIVRSNFNCLNVITALRLPLARAVSTTSFGVNTAGWLTTCKHAAQCEWTLQKSWLPCETHVLGDGMKRSADKIPQFFLDLASVSLSLVFSSSNPWILFLSLSLSCVTASLNPQSHNPSVPLPAVYLRPGFLAPRLSPLRSLTLRMHASEKKK